MKGGAGFAAGLVGSLVLHAALVAGVCAAWGLSAVAVEPDCAETPLTLDLAQVDLSFSDEARDEAPARPAPAAAPAPPPRGARRGARPRRARRAAGIINREAAAVMAALTLADELVKSQDDNTRLRRKLDESTHG